MRLVTFLDTGRFTSGYATPLLAALMQPVHEINGEAVPVWLDADVIHSDGLRFVIKGGSGRSAVRAELPKLSPTVRTTWAILCARSCYLESPFILWAEEWLTGRDRTPESALAVFGARAVPACDRAYIAHWATLSAAYPQDTTLAAQTAALIAAHLFPSGTFDFQGRAEAALQLGESQ